MKKHNDEKIKAQTQTFKPTSYETYAMDTVFVNYKGMKLTIEFVISGDDENHKPQKVVYGLRASHPGLQTRSGFTQGSDKFDIVKKLDGMTLTLQPDYRMDNKPDKAKYSMLLLTDGENGTQLLMYFEDNKLTGFYVSLFEGC